MTMTITEALREARRLLSDPSRWTQRAPGRDSHGRSVPGRNRGAVCWCLLGAIGKVTDGQGSLWQQCYELLDARAGGSTARFNDAATHEQVLEFLDRAIDELSP
jgi:hypothetical protein